MPWRPPTRGGRTARHAPGPGRFFHLTYCTNIHPSNGWDDVLANLRRHALPLTARLAPDAPFGIGLRLSGVESRELLAGDRLAQFRAFLDEQGLYVFTLNGFPYGPFHNQPVKENVHAPDWRDDERIDYTLRLIEILAALLPRGMEGGISTSPLSYKTWLDATTSQPGICSSGIWFESRGSGAAPAGSGHPHPPRYRAGAGWPAGKL